MLRNQDGIYSVKVALLAERGVVEYDPSKWTVEKLMSVRQRLLSLHGCSTRLTYNRRKSPILASMQHTYPPFEQMLQHYESTA
jgi:hypothetical protein